MRKCIFLLPFVLGSLTSCGTIDKMNCLVNQSTSSIWANQQAVATSTYVIRQNAQLIQETNVTIEENKRLIEDASGS